MKKLYNSLTQEILFYPRNDDEEVVGLDSDLIVLTQVETDPPDYDIETQVISSSYVVDLDKLEYILVWSINPKIFESDWNNFNMEMLSNTRFNQVYGQCLSTAPLVATALPTALDQVTSRENGLGLISIIWANLCTLGGATQEDKQSWKIIAEKYYLPQDFINVLIS